MNLSKRFSSQMYEKTWGSKNKHITLQFYYSKHRTYTLELIYSSSLSRDTEKI